MSAHLETLSSARAASLPAPTLRPARFDDYERIVQLGSTHGFTATSRHDWEHIWQGNPLWPRLGRDWPIGWVLETADGAIVGSAGNVPFLYKFRGQDLIAASGRAWSVARPYRGLALWLMDEHFSQSGVDLFIATSIGAMAAGAFDELCARVPLGDWETISYWITGYRAFANGALRNRGVPLAGALDGPAGAILHLKDALCAKRLPRRSASVTIDATDQFDSRFDAFWEALLRENAETLTADRSLASLSWHFAVPLRRGFLWVLTACRNGQLRAYSVFKRQDNGQGVSRIRLVDYQNIDQDLDVLPSFLHAALRRCATEGIAVLEHLGAALPKTRIVDASAPHRKRLANWQFFYRAADPVLEAELRKPTCWDPSPFDGDASLE
jgi:hypothetical protein